MPLPTRPRSRTQLTQLASQLTVAQLQLDQAIADLDAASTDQQTRQAQIAYYNAKNQVSQLTTQRTDLNAQVSRASITAPADGIVEAINVLVGADAPSGSAIVLDSGGLQASVTIAEADLSRVSIGQAASVTIDAVGGTAIGKVASDLTDRRRAATVARRSSTTRSSSP